MEAQTAVFRVTNVGPQTANQHLSRVGARCASDLWRGVLANPTARRVRIQWRPIERERPVP
jgi:hypothetical protein